MALPIYIAINHPIGSNRTQAAITPSSSHTALNVDCEIDVRKHDNNSKCYRPRSRWKFGGERASGGMPHYIGARRARERKVVTGKAAKVEAQTLHPELSEDPMTDDSMTLVELLQKSGD